MAKLLCSAYQCINRYLECDNCICNENVRLPREKLGDNYED